MTRTLGLSDRQTAELNRVSHGLQTRYAAAFQTLGRLPAADQGAARQQLDHQYRLDLVAGARDILGPWQLFRYEQLQRQSEGDPADPFGLTGAQLRDRPGPVTRPLTTPATTAADRVLAMQPYADSRKVFQDRFNRFLTPEQQRSWAYLVGDR
jgi:hypothetical protein